jgi:hypothetical protein
MEVPILMGLFRQEKLENSKSNRQKLENSNQEKLENSNQENYDCLKKLLLDTKRSHEVTVGQNWLIWGLS